MVNIVRRPRLKHTSDRLTARSAAVDKVLLYPAYFSDVEVIRNEFTRRQNKAERRIAIEFEQWDQFVHVHICSFHSQQLPRRASRLASLASCGTSSKQLAKQSSSFW